MTAEELSSVNERYEALEASIRTYNPNADFDKIRRAFAYARDRRRSASCSCTVHRERTSFTCR